MMMMDDDEEFHTPRSKDFEGEPEVEWMYANARFLPLPGMGSLAQANPFRWSRGTPEKIVEELDGIAEGWWSRTRPVRIRVVGQHYSHKFSNAHDAAQWLRECETMPDESDPNRVTSVAGWMARFMAAPALALYCRVHSRQPWVRKNLFYASSFALRACSKPRELSSMQQLYSSSHPRVQVFPNCMRNPAASCQCS